MKIVKNEFYRIVDIFGNKRECLIVSRKRGESVKILDLDEDFPIRLTYPESYIVKADLLSFFEISRFIGTEIQEIRDAILNRINKESRRAKV